MRYSFHMSNHQKNNNSDPISGFITLKPGRDKPVKQFHPWIFSGAIERIEGTPQPGDLVQLLDKNGRFLATAYYNPYSQIRCRILSWDVNETIDTDFWRRKMEQAINGRSALNLTSHTTAYRLIFGEADLLPGLVVDKYGNYLVMQCLTMGIDRRKTMLTELLIELCHPKGILDRSDVDVRKKEGLKQTTGLLWGEAPPDHLIIQENNIQFAVNLMGGHKTGFYLDQRDNRTAVCHPNHVQNKDVLNVFAYTGGFGVYAIENGAKQVTHIDSSIDALELAEKNVALNGWERPLDEYLAGDAFEILRHYRDEGIQFDTIILDPPKFAHSRRDIDKATRGYKDLNWLALRLLRPGGTLATFSCSGLISADLFQKIIFGAVVDAARHVQILAQLGQAPDHPIALTFSESAYLKGLLCRVW